jgi:hypothetical protein
MCEETELEKLKKRNKFLEEELAKEKGTNEKIEKEIEKALSKHNAHKTTTHF